jgi:hypothetical protein
MGKSPFPTLGFVPTHEAVVQGNFALPLNHPAEAMRPPAAQRLGDAVWPGGSGPDHLDAALVDLNAANSALDNTNPLGPDIDPPAPPDADPSPGIG